MDTLITVEMVNCLMHATTVSIIVMAVIQKFKILSWVQKDSHIFILNLIFSFIIGIFFSINFYNEPIENAIWISLFSFIGAPSLYTMLKKQNVINMNLISLDDTLPQNNEENDQKQV